VAALLIENKLLIGGAILLLALLAAIASQRLRLPLLITFLGLGMLLGSEGIGGIPFDDAQLARSIGILALIAILFEGGLTTDWVDIRPIAAPALVLSTVGVVITAAVTALPAYYLLDLKPSEALLLGAVVGSTDAAAVFATLRFTTLRRRLAALLSAESGANDPMAVALTIGLISWIDSPSYDTGDLLLLLVRQLGLGLVIGVALGVIAMWLLPRLPTDLAPFAPVASLAIAATTFGVAHAAHASGFLAVYVVALFLGNTPMPLGRSIVAFHEGLAFLAQVVLFIVLGLLVFPSQLGPVALDAIALAAVLVAVARPLAVFVSTIGFDFNLRERVFLSWAGLRGAVPIVLATFALSAGIGASNTIFNVVFFVVIVSALAQGLTLEPLADRLHLAGEGKPFPEAPVEVGAVQALGGEILEFRVGPGDAVVGSRVIDLGLPPDSIVMLIVRERVSVPPRGSTVVEAGDVLYVLSTRKMHTQVDALVEVWQRGPMPALQAPRVG
jgi:cell volume regulation protein A